MAPLYIFICILLSLQFVVAQKKKEFGSTSDPCKHCNHSLKDERQLCEDLYCPADDSFKTKKRCDDCLNGYTDRELKHCQKLFCKTPDGSIGFSTRYSRISDIICSSCKPKTNVSTREGCRREYCL